MRNIISGEIFKLCKSKYLWVGIGLAAGIMIMVVAILFGMSSTMIEFESILPKSTVEIFGIYHECYIYMIIAFMSCLLVNDDMRARTIDTMIQAGGRLKIYLSKVFIGLIISFSVVLATQISMMILGCIFIKDFGLWGMSAGFFIGFLAMQTFIGLLSSSISIALAFFVRKVTVALPVCVLFEFVVLGMVDGLSFFNENLKVIGNFIPGRMSMLFSAYEYYTQQNVVIGVIVGLLILAATSAIGMLHFKKADF